VVDVAGQSEMPEVVRFVGLPPEEMVGSLHLTTFLLLAKSSV